MLAGVLCLLLSTVPGMAQDVPGLLPRCGPCHASRISMRIIPRFADLRHQMDTVDRARERTFLRGVDGSTTICTTSTGSGRWPSAWHWCISTPGTRTPRTLRRSVLLTLMKFPKWDYFLEGGVDVVGLQRAPNSALAVAMVVEALGDRIDASTREAWLKTMAVAGDRAVLPCDLWHALSGQGERMDDGLPRARTSNIARSSGSRRSPSGPSS